MLSRLREHFGTAGLLVAIVALIAALAGGAIAASGGSGSATASKGKQGKQGKQGKPGKPGPQGPAGPAGPQGPAGPKGDTGAAGAAGAKGATGATGANGTNGSNGATGATGPTGFSGFTATLPPGATETGTFAVRGRPPVKGPPPQEEEFIGGALIPLTLPIPLPAPIEGFEKIKKVELADPVPAECNGGSVEEPKAAPGYMCVYNGPFSKDVLGTIASPGAVPFKVGVSGAFILSGVQKDLEGSFAVTACGGTEFPCP